MVFERSLSPIVSVVVPAYNEAEIIEENILMLRTALKDADISFEIIIAEDGSTDRSYSISLGLSDLYPDVRVIHSDARIGKGEAIKRAWRISSGSFIIFMDMDMPVDLFSLGPLVDYLKHGSSLVIGSRYLGDSSLQRPFFKTLKSKLYNFLLRSFFGHEISDYQCGFKGMIKDDLSDLLLSVEDSVYFFDTELIIKAIRAGLSVRELPVSWREPEGRVSKVTLSDEIVMIFRLVSFLLSN
ncbi:glycosyl transferase [Candidatus Bathyarchaeota archaeon]|nr:glycosyl transferase [Candidatus Bathyarchaeota archaeon]MDP6048860.1 glycosyltransferase [Candidatus Bathyarchaeota archaeon]